MSAVNAFWGAFLGILFEASPFLLVGFALAAAARAVLPLDWASRWLGRGPRAVVVSAAVGAPLPLCSCSVIPAAAALRKAGASRGATTSFLISTPETGLDSIAITWALLDPIMTVARPVAAVLTALVTGLVVDRTDADPDAEPGPAGSTEGAAPGLAARAATGSVGDACCSSSGCGDSRSRAGAETDGQHGVTGRQRATRGGEHDDSGDRAVRRGSDAAAHWKEAFSYTFGPLLDDLAPWLLAGFLLAALVAVALPDDLLAGTAGSGWLAAVLVLAISTPTYVCASAATPVAAALVAKGLSPGAALLFLLAGPATNVTTMLVVHRTLGRRVLGIYLAGVVGGALLCGVAVDMVYGRLGIDLASRLGDAMPSPGPVQVVSALVVIALLCASVLRPLRSLRPWARA